MKRREEEENEKRKVGEKKKSGVVQQDQLYGVNMIMIVNCWGESLRIADSTAGIHPSSQQVGQA